ncbi:hypothetical protein GCM10023340_09570 [Nocardioides marinquilinus]|uniref:DUF2231 domain-containing protein n=1 Tax=Nocardioides marinquilinus TaxID=1210400 RepID=A0ABP9PB06_9ACTN
MFDLVDGLPVHPLVVHAVVVLLPLACLGTLAIAVVPAWRARFGPLVVACAAVATVLVPIATSSGEALEERVGDPGEHAELGDQLIWFAVPLLVLSLALVLLDRRRRRAADADGGGSSGRVSPRALTTGVAVLAVIAALAASVQIYRVGESGARAVWGDQVQSGSQ